MPSRAPAGGGRDRLAAQPRRGEEAGCSSARALLQRADVLILDESFAALDPETLRHSLGFVLKEAPTLLVIAHP